MKRKILLGLAVVLAVLQHGCRRRNDEANLAGSGGGFFHHVSDSTVLYKWDGTYSSAVLNSSADSAAQTASDVLKRMAFTLAEPERTPSGAVRIAGSKDDQTTVLAVITPKTGSSSDLKVRVGTVGDRTGSERIVEEIQTATKRN